MKHNRKSLTICASAAEYTYGAEEVFIGQYKRWYHESNVNYCLQEVQLRIFRYVSRGSNFNRLIVC